MGRPKRRVLPKKFCPRPYQQDMVIHGLEAIRQFPDIWHLYQSPTGTGKSHMEGMILEAVPKSIFCTPRVEILAGVLDKMGIDIEDMSQDRLVKTAGEYGMYTPVRLRNILAKGELPWDPDLLVVDEVHHDLAETYQDITMYLNGVPKLGLSATCYRGSPKATARFLEQWNDTVNVVLTQSEAVEQEWCSFPSAVVWPLVDDDIIEVSGGEMKASAADAVITDRIDSLAERLRLMWCPRSKMWDRPTMVALPTTNLVNQLYTALEARGMAAVKVTQATSRTDRNSAFRMTVQGLRILIQIDVVSEGVDLPIRRLIDCRPTLSPVKWVQQIGRIMRRIKVDEPAPEYICCCRNLERHGYLMEGLFPDPTIGEAQQAFDKVSKRAGMRALGMEELGRFVVTPVQLLNGVSCVTYNLVAMSDFERTEYIVLLHPNHLEPVRGERRMRRNTDGTIDWRTSHWKLVDSLPDLKGFASAKPHGLSDKQRERWQQWAEPLGLNPHKEVNNRSIEILFFLKDLRLKL